MFFFLWNSSRFFSPMSPDFPHTSVTFPGVPGWDGRLHRTSALVLTESAPKMSNMTESWRNYVAMSKVPLPLNFSPNGHILDIHGPHINITHRQNLAVRGKVDGRRGRGRNRLKYLYSLCTYLKDKVSPLELIRASENRNPWHHMVANSVEDGTDLLSIHCGWTNGGNWTPSVQTYGIRTQQKLTDQQTMKYYRRLFWAKRTRWRGMYEV